MPSDAQRWCSHRKRRANVEKTQRKQSMKLHETSRNHRYLQMIWSGLVGLTSPRFSSLGLMHLERTQLYSGVQVTTSFEWHFVELNKSEVKHSETWWKHCCMRHLHAQWCTMNSGHRAQTTLPVALEPPSSFSFSGFSGFSGLSALSSFSSSQGWSWMPKTSGI